MSSLELEALVYSRLLYAFADMFCFYSYGLSDLAKIGRWIATWSHEEHVGWKPSLVIVLADKCSQGPNALSIAEGLLATTVETLTSLPLSSYFFDTTFLQIPETDSPNDFRMDLHRRASTVRQRRRDAGLCFSVEHFNALFERAFESAATLKNQPFDPIRSARQDLPVSTELTDHLVNFMNQMPLARNLLSFASPVIASSLLLDHYVPDMHPFKPAEVFERLYQDACTCACKRTAKIAREDGHLLPSALMNAIRDNLTALFNRLGKGEAAVSIHRVRPPTAGHSILCIDGGGVRGILPPAILAQIQNRLDLPIPIQELFTLAYGVSAGALIVLALFINGWSVERCSVEFAQLAKIAFSPPSVLSLPGLSWARSILLDSIYSEHGIEGALRKAFGDGTLAESCHAKRIGAKVGIPAATIRRPCLSLFTNYNAMGEERSGYLVLRETEHVKVWEAGRSSSAAPVYFPPKYLPGLGTFQDAGTLANNPIIVALSEFAAIYGNEKPDLVLNIGTGTSPDMPLQDQKPRFMRDSWPVRLKRGYMALMQGKKTWNDAESLSKRLGGKSGQYRLDIPLAQPPSLDDTTSMATLTSLVHHDSVSLGAIPEIAHHLFATLFYFELDSLPTLSGSNFSISGHICCVRKGQDRALPKILQRLRKATLYVNGKPTRSFIDTDTHGNIRQTVDLTTGKSLLIELKEEDSRCAFPLSGSP
ncbi:hypothetical protein CEP51_013959 [Fusarium floridanum]|uniref:PNPLA domain-containing protein n=1 Tax=Fusarium floridanum TaxID=1325733 RepID=A0A428Q1R1_9HYPO|nr:hypothetical protein CEP51_013959 [Fusarium floridanum]